MLRRSYFKLKTPGFAAEPTEYRFNSSAEQSADSRIQMTPPMLYRERIVEGPLRNYKITECIWIGWCLCEEENNLKRTSGEPYSRCTVCRKFVKNVTQYASKSNTCKDATHSFSNLQEAFESISSAARPASCTSVESDCVDFRDD